MTVKKFYIGVAVSAITFIIGFIMVNNNFGRLCMLSGIILLNVFVSAIVLNAEEKSK